MSDQVSGNLALPFLQPSQAQKHVTHNEALERLDILVQLTVEAFDATTPPSLPEEGEVHALGTGASGAWAGHDGELAARVGDAWLFIAPRAGWRAWSRETARLRIWDGSSWAGALDGIDSLGINATADATNRLSVAAAGTLLDHDGSDHRMVINKAAPGDTASLVFQSDFSGRAEMGLAGADDYSFKVSPDGDTWNDAIRIDRTTAKVTIAEIEATTLSGDAVTQSRADTTRGRVARVGDFGLGRTSANEFRDDPDAVTGSGFYDTLPGLGFSNIPFIHLAGPGGNRDAQIFFGTGGEEGDIRYRARASNFGNDYGPLRKVWNEGNTTVDGNGFILEASPVLRLQDDHTEEPVKPVGARMTRIGTGHYRICGVGPLAETGWRIHTPSDVNGNKLLALQEPEYDAAARTLTVRTHEPAWRAGRLVPGRPMDIPAGTFVMLRFSADPEDAD